MPFEIYMALRFLREARFQTLIILAAVAVGVALVVFLSALIHGQQDKLLNSTLDSQPHLIVTRVESPPMVLPEPKRVVAALVEEPPAHELLLHDWKNVQDMIRSIPGVINSSVVASGPGLATRDAASRNIAIRGIIPEDYDQIVNISSHLTEGRLQVSADQVRIGVELARDLGLEVGEKFRLQTADSPPETFSVAGIFDLGHKEANRRWVLTSLRVGQNLLRIPGAVTSIEVRVADIFAADEIAERIASRSGLQVDSWIHLNQALMIGLQSQNRFRYLIQFFMVAAVTLAMAFVLLVAVLQKSKEIGILRTFGTSDRQVIGVFLWQGIILGSLGALAGSILGAALAFVYRTAVTPGLIGATALITIIVGLASAAFPAWRATRTDPAKVMRYG